jgi:hypothetical protein
MYNDEDDEEVPLTKQSSDYQDYYLRIKAMAADKKWNDQ